MTSSYILYGIPNCDTVKKARSWLQMQSIDFIFHDFKKQGISRELLSHWLKQCSRDILLNRKGTTWRALDEAVKLSITDDDAARELMLEKPSIIKRPVLCRGNSVLEVGFIVQRYHEIFSTHE